MRLAASAALLSLIFAGTVFRRGIGVRGGAAFIVWAVAVTVVTLAIYAAVRGSLDFTSINARKEFLRAATIVCAGTAAVGGLVHRRIFGDAARFVADEATLVALSAGACLLHVFVYGWPLGFPVPGAHALFFPFLAPIFVIVHALVGGTTLVFISWRARR
jgi:hypothetical protein